MPDSISDTERARTGPQRSNFSLASVLSFFKNALVFLLLFIFKKKRLSELPRCPLAQHQTFYQHARQRDMPNDNLTYYSSSFFPPSFFYLEIKIIATVKEKRKTRSVDIPRPVVFARDAAFIFILLSVRYFQGLCCRCRITLWILIDSFLYTVSARFRFFFSLALSPFFFNFNIHECAAGCARFYGTRRTAWKILLQTRPGGNIYHVPTTYNTIERIRRPVHPKWADEFVIGRNTSEFGNETLNWIESSV